jgi:CPA2 family monovalent cation:H+ antiporter-2
LEALPLRDAFAVLFFVSVGMLFEPSVLKDSPLELAAIVAIIMLGKAAAAFVIVVALGSGIRTATLVGAALAQIGEFSFILVALAISLDTLPEEATSLILGGALISITLNPFVFHLSEALERRLAAWPSLVAYANRRLPESIAAPSLRRHVVICGYGRAGSNLARTLAGRQLPFIAIENNPFVFERARLAGVPIVFGDSTSPVVLEEAYISDSRALAVTFGNHPDTEITVQNAKRLNPAVDVVARAEDAEAYASLRDAGANEIIDPAFEAGVEFVRHILHRYGIDSREIAAVQTRRRAENYGFVD